MEESVCVKRNEHKETKDLTERQTQYLEAYRKAGSTADAAKILNVTVGTAAEQLCNVKAKLGVATIKDLKLDGPKAPRTDRASWIELLDLAKKQDYRCALSGVSIADASSASLDHIIPVSKGGSDTIENLQWLSSSVNQAKATMNNEEFIEMCNRVAHWNR